MKETKKYVKLFLIASGCMLAAGILSVLASGFKLSAILFFVSSLCFAAAALNLRNTEDNDK